MVINNHGTPNAQPPAKPKQGSIEWYEYWLDNGCVEFYEDGKPKVFDLTPRPRKRPDISNTVR